MHRLLIMGMGVLMAGTCAFGVDGIAVGVRSSYTDSYGLHTGKIRAHIIKNNQVVDVKELYSQNARCVCIKPSGTHIAFISSGGKLCVKPMSDGGTVQELGSISTKAWIDWSNDQYIYKTNGFPGNTLTRVDVGTGAEVTLVSGGEFRQTHISPDGSRGTTTLSAGNTSPWWWAATFTIGNGKMTVGAKSGGCGASLSPDGRKWTNNLSGHRDCAIRAFGSGDKLAGWNTSKCSGAGGYWNRLRWATNSNDWVCFTQGSGEQLESYHNIVLYYVPDNGSTNIQVTKNSSSNKGYDEADDFWVGDPDQAFSGQGGTTPDPNLPATKIIEPEDLTLTMGAQYTLKAEGENVSWSYDASSDGQGTVSIGTGAEVTFTVPTGVTGAKTITITATGANGTDTKTYSLADAPVGIRFMEHGLNTSSVSKTGTIDVMDLTGRIIASYTEGTSLESVRATHRGIIILRQGERIVRIMAALSR